MMDLTPGLLGWFQNGMDRELPAWVEPDWERDVLNLGPGKKIIPGTIGLDWPDWDGESGHLPFDDNSVGGIYASHFFEHISDPRPLLEDCARVLAPGCPLTILVPNGMTPIYFQDLDHKTPFIIDTWKNWLESRYYTQNKPIGLGLVLGTNVNIGVKEGNLALVTQLIKEGE